MFMGYREYAYERDKKPPSAYNWWSKTEAGTFRK
jgi:hypothetical protein